MSVTVRQFQPHEWALMKAVRLKALQADPGVFGSNYAREAAFTDEEWQTRLRSTTAASFGVFDGDTVIGLTGVYIRPDDAAVAGFVADWLEPSHRGRGLTAHMYAARLGWARAQPSVRRCVIAFRADNAAAIRAGERNGFTFTHAEDHVWNDGASVPQRFYELRF